MSKLRVYELAKELNVKTDELIKKISKLGLGDRSNFSSLEPEEITKIKGSYQNLVEKAKEQMSEVKPGPGTAVKTEPPRRKRVVFDNRDNAMGGRSYSSDQRHGYTPPPRKPRPQTMQRPADTRSAERPVTPAPGRPSATAATGAAPENKVRQDAVPTQAQAPNVPKLQQPDASSAASAAAPVQKTAAGAPAAPKTTGKLTKNEKRAIIGTVSNVNDYSRPMPTGRPSTLTRQPVQTSRPDSPRGEFVRSEHRKPYPGRPSQGAPAGRRPMASGSAPGTRPVRPFESRDKSFPSKKRDGAPVAIESEITKDSGKRKKQKKTVQNFEKDKLEKRSKLSKSKVKQEITTESFNRGDFDFGKKLKQKSGKYKEKSEKERSERLDELLQRETVYLAEETTVKEFAELINKSPNEIIMKLMGMGKMMTLNHTIDYDTAALIAMDYDIALEQEEEVEENYAEAYELDFEDDPADLVKRAPVVTVMGHVDHGKTSLLDAIRHTGVARGEAGGITQHIGASEVQLKDEKILFLDTPGHEAFTSLRARGAKVTDIAILVVAADDGVMPQTVEAIDHSRAAGVPIIVAINKIDKPSANPDRVKQELSEKGLVIEEWGGDVIAVPVSAKTGEGLDRLLEMVLIVAEMLDLKANPDRPAIGTVIEAKVVKGRGSVATIIVEKGTLNLGDPVVVGKTHGKIKAMYNDKGKKVKKVGPSTSVEIDGLNDIPLAGEKLYVTPDERTASKIADKYAVDHRARTLAKSASVRLEDLFDKIKEGSMKELNIILKADVHGSVEAIKSSLQKLSDDEIKVHVIRSDVGAISESDVILASASKALIIGFNVRPSVNVSAIAEEEGVDIRTYNIIYQAIDDVRDAMKGMLDPVFKEVVMGRAQVRATFRIPNGVVAGCYVTNGKITRNSQVRVLRDGIVLFTGKISSLRRFKDDVREVATGYECGLGIEKFSDIREDDELEAFVMEEVKA